MFKNNWFPFKENIPELNDMEKYLETIAKKKNDAYLYNQSYHEKKNSNTNELIKLKKSEILLNDSFEKQSSMLNVLQQNHENSKNTKNTKNIMKYKKFITNCVSTACNDNQKPKGMDLESTIRSRKTNSTDLKGLKNQYLKIRWNLERNLLLGNKSEEKYKTAQKCREDKLKNNEKLELMKKVDDFNSKKRMYSVKLEHEMSRLRQEKFMSNKNDE